MDSVKPGDLVVCAVAGKDYERIKKNLPEGELFTVDSIYGHVIRLSGSSYIFNIQDFTKVGECFSK